MQPHRELPHGAVARISKVGEAGSASGPIATAQLGEAHLTTTILWRLCPWPSRIAIGDSEAAEGEGPLDVCQVPQGRVWSVRVVAEKLQEDAFMLHFDGHRSPA